SAVLDLLAVQLHRVRPGERIQRSRRPAEIGLAGIGPAPVPDHDRGAGLVEPHAVETDAPGRRQALMSASDSTIVPANPVYRRRRRINRLMLALSGLTLGSGLFWLAWIILTLLVK